jgi:hypothetical protein
MIKFSMNDPRWSNLGIGHPMHEYGCLITSISMIAGKTPDRILNALNEKNCFDMTGKLEWEKSKAALGLSKYENIPYLDPITHEPNIPPKYPIIAETHDNAALGFPQHFFVVVDGDHIVDPLDGLQKSIDTYGIVSYRLLA